MALLGRGRVLKLFWGLLITHVVEQPLLSMLSSILTFEFDLDLECVYFFFGPYWTFFGIGVGFENVFESTHVVEQILFSMFSSILTLDFDLILGSF